MNREANKSAYPEGIVLSILLLVHHVGESCWSRPIFFYYRTQLNCLHGAENNMIALRAIRYLAWLESLISDFSYKTVERLNLASASLGINYYRNIKGLLESHVAFKQNQKTTMVSSSHSWILLRGWILYLFLASHSQRAPIQADSFGRWWELRENPRRAALGGQRRLEHPTLSDMQPLIPMVFGSKQVIVL
jgi:hypothetical protein